MKVVLLKVGTMGGSEYHKTAYIDATTARLIAEDLKEEWKSFVPEVVDAELIPGDRCAVGDSLYKLDTTTAVEMHRIRGLEKLTQEEQLALGLKE